ncbi:hypothetical protein Tco_0418857 [Tanacetum coccineum]|uniref:Uncharacterized protein n=1 Tax=Tanacetum coccineum TaxID=301880 RepID=A0ABQ5FXX1_9ASTR
MADVVQRSSTDACSQEDISSCVCVFYDTSSLNEMVNIKECIFEFHLCLQTYFLQQLKQQSTFIVAAHEKLRNTHMTSRELTLLSAEKGKLCIDFDYMGMTLLQLKLASITIASECSISSTLQPDYGHDCEVVKQRHGNRTVSYHKRFDASEAVQIVVIDIGSERLAEVQLH